MDPYFTNKLEKKLNNAESVVNIALVPIPSHIYWHMLSVSLWGASVFAVLKLSAGQ